MDEGLESFAETLEKYLSRVRGRVLTLSPRDFELARAWYARGVSAQTVIAGVDAVRAAGREPGSLAFCEREIEAAAADTPRRAPLPADQPPDLGDAQDALRAALDALPEALGRHFAAVRQRLEGPVADPEALDAEVSRIAVEVLPERVRAEVDAQAQRAAKRQKDRVSADALNAAQHRSRLQRARKHLRLPYLSR